MMRRISWRKAGTPGRRHSLAGAVGVALVSVLAAAAPALGETQTRNLTIHTVGPPQSEDVTCLVPGPDDSCTTLQISETHTVTSNLAGQGTSQITAILSFFADGCGSADEVSTVTFAAGTISTHSPFPTTCGPVPPNGLKINGPFEVTGGTGAFAGATGGGQEFSSIGNSNSLPIIYIGTITF
jgi:hypothetical protein